MRNKLGMFGLFMALFALYPLTVSADSATAPGEPETLLSGDWHVGGYGGPHLKVSNVAGEAAILLGGRGGAIFDRRFSVGGGGYGMLNQPRVPGNGDEYLSMGYGGLILEYIFGDRNVLHGTAGLMLGAGGVGVHAPQGVAGRRHEEMARGSNFWLVEPEVMAEVNMTRTFRLAVGGTYRLVTGVDIEGLTNRDVSGLGASLLFKFGSF